MPLGKGLIIVCTAVYGVYYYGLYSFCYILCGLLLDLYFDWYSGVDMKSSNLPSLNYFSNHSPSSTPFVQLAGNFARIFMSETSVFPSSSLVVFCTFLCLVTVLPMVVAPIPYFRE